MGAGKGGATGNDQQERREGEASPHLPVVPSPPLPHPHPPLLAWAWAWAWER